MRSKKYRGRRQSRTKRFGGSKNSLTKKEFIQFIKKYNKKHKTKGGNKKKVKRRVNKRKSIKRRNQKGGMMITDMLLIYSYLQNLFCLILNELLINCSKL